MLRQQQNFLFLCTKFMISVENISYEGYSFRMRFDLLNAEYGN